MRREIREAHLIGNGYSVLPEFLDTMADKVTFAMNGVARIFKHTEWRPTYYLMVSTRYHHSDQPFQYDVQNAVNASHRSFIDSEQWTTEFFHYHPRVSFINVNEEKKWMQSATFSKYATAMLTAIQLASFMGFDPIILHGVDGYREEGNNHLVYPYHSYPFRISPEQNERMEEAFIIARDNCPSKIYDATKSEGLKVFERWNN